MVPLIPLASVVMASIGGYCLYWYHSLSRDEQKEADRLANQYAMDLYNLTLDQLTAQQIERIHSLVKQRYAA
jgi:hypothetical protein